MLHDRNFLARQCGHTLSKCDVPGELYSRGPREQVAAVASDVQKALYGLIIM